MSPRYRRLRLAAVSLVALAASLSSAKAETLADALALAYQSNPTLQSQRALQRQTDETYVQARAGWRPTLTSNTFANYQRQISPINNNTIQQNRLNMNLQANQPLFTNGRVAAAVDAAEATVGAGREALRATEATVLQQVIQAYQDVLRDQQIIAIRQQGADVLARQLTETRARFDAGLITVTDVARAEAQLAAARGQLALARAALQNSRAAYSAVVGQNPGELETPPVLPGLPDTIEEALSALEAENPNLRRAMLTEHASRARVAQVRAQRGPTVNLTGTYGYAGNIDPFGPFQRNLNIGAQATLPILTGGVISSQIRGALEQNNSDRILIEQNRRTMVQALMVAWNQMLAAHANIVANEEQVRAAIIAFEGSQEQFRVGLATTLDVLITQDLLRLAQLALVQAQRDEYVAQSQVLNAIGRLELGSLASNVPYYDPRTNFERVRNAGSLPWDPLIRLLDFDRGADDVIPRPEFVPADPEGPALLNPGEPPAALQDAEAALGRTGAPGAPLPAPGGLRAPPVR